MIIVTGTKRSGTSMWMQILKAAGYPILGEAFPRDWGDTIRDANPGGFYESPLRHGIYYATNPHPRTGAFLPPSDSRNMVVKVFALGLAKSDLAYVDRAIATMRSVREYQASIQRLYSMERNNKLELASKAGRPAESVPDYVYMPPALEWWQENYSLIRDALVRRYPLHMVSYASVLRAPEATIAEALGWLGGGDRDGAMRAVQEDLRPRSEVAEAGQEPLGLSQEQAALCDELYARVDERRPLDASFIDRLNETHDALEPLIAQAARASQEQRRSVRRTALEHRTAKGG